AAGFAKIGNYAKVTFQDSMRMIDLNDKAAVAVTLACLPYMKQGDRIIQMCSTAAFQPLQHINIYGASKAFLYHYTRALRMELFPRGIVVTAVCPFWVKDTEFIGIAKGDGGLHTRSDGEISSAGSKPPIRHFPFATTAERVAKRGLRASRAGWAVVTPGAFCVIHRFFTKLLPREAAIWIWELMRRM
ncbi:MAG: SDR family NAD(P)-dependent oxidoreductase, partial [Eubacterium sp.]|nr:SDR family NAD(P)-dependent oxidoreductase [Eubacterium sp.]